MSQTGLLQKMRATWTTPDRPVDYELRLDETLTPLNALVGSKIKLAFTGKIRCVACGRDIKKTFQQGYCFPCTQKLAETDLCIVKPELCHHHKGTCRDNEFATKHCFITHVVYLAVSSGPKVGITREHQKLTRWADQGASAAIELLRVPNRLAAGLVEVELAKHLPDKTNWRKLLTGDAPPKDLLELKTKLKDKIPTAYKMALSPHDEITKLKYPILAYPVKINSYNFDKNPILEDKLLGIKGQYLIFQNGVINVRKFQGYEIEFST